MRSRSRSICSPTRAASFPCSECPSLSNSPCSVQARPDGSPVSLAFTYCQPAAARSLRKRSVVSGRPASATAGRKSSPRDGPRCAPPPETPPAWRSR